MERTHQVNTRDSGPATRIPGRSSCLELHDLRDDVQPGRLEPNEVDTRRRGLDQDPGAGPLSQHPGEAVGSSANAELQDLTLLGERADLAFARVHVDANVVHGWRP